MKKQKVFVAILLDCSLLKITLPGGFLGASRGLPEGIFGLIGSLLHVITKLYTFINHISFTFLLQLVLWNIIPGLPSYVPVETARN